MSALHDTLHADGPLDELREELMLFGQFVGSWDASWSGIGVDGRQAVDVPGEVHFGWALGGRAVIDTWAVPKGAEWADATPRPGFFGSTIRFYDPDLGAWRSTWMDPPNGVVRRFIGRPERGDIVLLSNEQWPHLRWSFTQIRADSATWRAEIRLDESSLWLPHQTISLRRQARP
jgi:hypothetical protein